jgi:dihydroflavonol-4-reductase
MADDLDLTGIPVSTSSPVLVTGATGYVAGWIVKGLLDAGVTVHAAVRDPGNAAKVQPLLDLAVSAPGELHLYAADLLEAGSYTEAMQGCAVVIHTASPFTTKVADPQRELVDPALLGTRSVLESADAVESVGRVVLTSSVAAIFNDAADCARAPGGRLTEHVWNTTATLEDQPYNLSKTLAEREAWRIADAQQRWRLVVINPALVVGPAVTADPTSESFANVRKMVDGTSRFGAPRICFGIVDVRDVARAHIAAAYLPEAGGRHILAAEGTDFFACCQLLRPRYGGRLPLPRRPVPKRLFRLVSPFAGLSRHYVDLNVDHPWRADNTKSIRELGVTYRPIREALEEMVEQLVDRGVVTPRGSAR